MQITLLQGILLASMAFIVGLDDLMEAFFSSVRSWLRHSAELS